LSATIQIPKATTSREDGASTAGPITRRLPMKRATVSLSPLRRTRVPNAASAARPPSQIIAARMWKKRSHS